MIRPLGGALALLGAVALVVPSAAASASPRERLIVELAPGATAAALPGDHVVAEIGDGFVAVEVTAAEQQSLARSNLVESIEPDGIAHAAVEPDDPCWTACATQVASANDEWGAKRIGSELAWDVTTGSTTVVVGLIDSGVRVSHVDLAGRVTPVVVDPALGIDDEFGHGTAVAGLIAATGQNGTAIAGMAWNVRLRSYKVLDANGDGFLSTIATAVNTAVADGVGVINLSLTTNTDSAALHSAIQNAARHNIPVVTAAGNSNSETNQTYPGRYDEVIGVASIGRNGQKTSFSNFGPWVEVAAPGVDVVSLSQLSDDGVVAAGGTGRGTSFSAPYVTGTIALMLSQNRALTAGQVRVRLMETAEPSPSPGMGGGLVDAASAVRLPGPGSPSCPAGPSGWLLDGYGGLRRIGSAPVPSGGPYWPGWDIARDVALAPIGGYLLDAFGGIHRISGAPRVTGSGYWPGRDLAKAIVARPDGGGTYVLDGYGGIHLGRTPGSTVAAPVGTGYWPGWDIARDLAIDPTDPNRGWVLDAFGGLHPFGGAPSPQVGNYHAGLATARSITVAVDGLSGTIADQDGNLSAWAVPGTPLPPRRYAATTEPLATREVVFAGGDAAAGTILTGTGSFVPLQGKPCWTHGLWTFDIGRAFAAM